MKGKDIILGILTVSSKTGYEINDLFQKRFNHFFDGTYGMIYPTLKKLESDKLITKKEIIQNGKPNKNIYKITKQGEKEFNSYLVSSVEEDKYKSDLLTRMFFYSPQNDLKKLFNFIEYIINDYERKLNSLKINDEKNIKKMNSYQKITYDFGVEYYQFLIKFWKKKAKELKKK